MYSTVSGISCSIPHREHWILMLPKSQYRPLFSFTSIFLSKSLHLRPDFFYLYALLLRPLLICERSSCLFILSSVCLSLPDTLLLRRVLSLLRYVKRASFLDFFLQQVKHILGCVQFYVYDTPTLPSVTAHREHFHASTLLRCWDKWSDVVCSSSFLQCSGILDCRWNKCCSAVSPLCSLLCCVLPRYYCDKCIREVLLSIYNWRFIMSCLLFARCWVAPSPFVFTLFCDILSRCRDILSCCCLDNKWFPQLLTLSEFLLRISTVAISSIPPNALPTFLASPFFTRMSCYYCAVHL